MRYEQALRLSVISYTPLHKNLRLCYQKKKHPAVVSACTTLATHALLQCLVPTPQ